MTSSAGLHKSSRQALFVSWHQVAFSNEVGIHTRATRLSFIIQVRKTYSSDSYESIQFPSYMVSTLSPLGYEISCRFSFKKQVVYLSEMSTVILLLMVQMVPQRQIKCVVGWLHSHQLLLCSNIHHFRSYWMLRETLYCCAQNFIFTVYNHV